MRLDQIEVGAVVLIENPQTKEFKGLTGIIISPSRACVTNPNLNATMSEGLAETYDIPKEFIGKKFCTFNPDVLKLLSCARHAKSKEENA